MSLDEHVDLRRISDAATLRALSHPVRISLLELILFHGPMTATQAGERLGETPGNCSFHLRHLAKHGFVEEAGGGKGRARPWKLSTLGMSITSDDDDPAAEIAADALVRMLQDRHMARLDRWRRSRRSYPRAWRDAAFDNQTMAWLTPEEMQKVSERMLELIMSVDRERLTDPSLRPPDALPVEILTFGYPIEPADDRDA
jgi:DNA-binding transcriptional ArsR family regulator